MTDPLQGFMKQLGNVQATMQEMQEKLAKLEVTGESGAGMVKGTMNGRHDVRRVEVDPSLLSEDVEMLEDLILSAVNQAKEKAAELQSQTMGSVTGGLNIPGLGGLPF